MRYQFINYLTSLQNKLISTNKGGGGMLACLKKGHREEGTAVQQTEVK